MKVLFQPRRLIVRRPCQGGFTLAEIQFSIVLLLLVIGGVIASQLFGLRLYEYIRPKLDASDQARRTIGKLLDEVRCANLIRVGNGSFNGFTEILSDTPQQGNALQIYPTLNTNQYVRYYWDANDQALKRMSSEPGSTVVVVAQSVTNEVIFTSEDFAGNVITNNQNNYVIGVDLQFYRTVFGGARNVQRGDSDYYRLRTKITRRILM